MQTLQLIGAVTVLGLLGLVAVYRAQQARTWAPVLVVVMSLLAAATAVLIVTVLMTDLVPDEMEAALLPIVLFVIAPAAMVALWIGLRSRR